MTEDNLLPVVRARAQQPNEAKVAYEKQQKMLPNEVKVDLTRIDKNVPNLLVVTSFSVNFRF